MHPHINLVYIEALWNGLSRILRHTSTMCFKGKVYLLFSLYIRNRGVQSGIYYFLCKVYLLFSLYIRIYSFPFTFVIFEF